MTERTYTLILFTPNWWSYSGDTENAEIERHHGLTKEELVKILVIHETQKPKKISSEDLKAYWFEEHRLPDESPDAYEERMQGEWYQTLQEVMALVNVFDERQKAEKQEHLRKQQELKRQQEESAKAAQEAEERGLLQELLKKYPDIVNEVIEQVRR